MIFVFHEQRPYRCDQNNPVQIVLNKTLSTPEQAFSCPDLVKLGCSRAKRDGRIGGLSVRLRCSPLVCFFTFDLLGNFSTVDLGQVQLQLPLRNDEKPESFLPFFRRRG